MLHVRTSIACMHARVEPACTHERIHNSRTYARTQVVEVEKVVYKDKIVEVPVRVHPSIYLDSLHFRIRTQFHDSPVGSLEIFGCRALFSRQEVQRVRCWETSLARVLTVT